MIYNIRHNLRLKRFDEYSWCFAKRGDKENRGILLRFFCYLCFVHIGKCGGGTCGGTCHYTRQHGRGQSTHGLTAKHSRT